MRLVIRGGHNFQCPGAHALLDETTEDRLVKDAVIKYLKIGGDTVIDATPGNCSGNDDLNFGTDTANNANADLFVPVHLNKAYDTYTGAIGSEVWINPKNPVSVAIGTRIVNNLGYLGFKNRGLKDGINVQHLHDIKATNMSAVLVEICFCEATEDVALYKALGPDRIGKVIAEGILGHAIYSVAPVVVVPLVAIITVPATRVNNSIALLQIEINKQGGNLLVDGFFGPKTLAACPTLLIGAQGEITRWLQKRLKLSLQDGIFGTGTKQAVINYQSAMSLEADGIVGQNTWAALLR